MPVSGSIARRVRIITALPTAHIPTTTQLGRLAPCDQCPPTSTPRVTFTETLPNPCPSSTGTPTKASQPTTREEYRCAHQTVPSRSRCRPSTASWRTVCPRPLPRISTIVRLVRYRLASTLIHKLAGDRAQLSADHAHRAQSPDHAPWLYRRILRSTVSTERRTTDPCAHRNTIEPRPSPSRHASTIPFLFEHGDTDRGESTSVVTAQQELTYSPQFTLTASTSTFVAYPPLARLAHSPPIIPTLHLHPRALLSGLHPSSPPTSTYALARKQLRRTIDQ
ncbi:hypothetical protein FOMPIDRAFT_1047808 [Fomitopsis schrenkii]|uniref:Uncharacterized protein n=1 Tax=Fomitopsis schrenkii TaxID=2126942 RepID=S8EGU2_FOMSC|nr:hypothetical protein FOMPIDRAFT_1047808 [Fomitopsis schrenkii]